MNSTWQRPNWKASTGSRTRQHYIAFFKDACPEFEVRAAEDGLPDGDPLSSFELEAFTDPSWLAGWTAGPLAAFAPTSQVREARAAMGAWSGKTDGKTLAGLQGGMALCRALARVGAIAVLDVVALRWWEPGALLALSPDRPFDITEHIAIRSYDDPQAFSHTRGMAKFARPDLGIFRADQQPLLLTVATAMALGLDPIDGETARLGDVVVRFQARPDDTGQTSPRIFNHWLELELGPRALLL